MGFCVLEKNVLTVIEPPNQISRLVKINVRNWRT